MNLIKSKRKNYNDIILVGLFAFLPISLILGNAISNLNIFLIDIYFLAFCLYKKNWNWSKNIFFYSFILIWIYLIFNSLLNPMIINEEYNIFNTYHPLNRSIFFIRFIIFIFAFEFFLRPLKEIFNKIMFVWLIVISILIFDVFFERIFGFNSLGFTSPSSKRIVSFFKDELVIGGYLLGFAFIASAYLFENIKKNFNKKIFANLFFITIFIGIYLTGERSNFAKYIIIASFIFIFIDKKLIFLNKKKIILIALTIFVISNLLFKDVYNRQLEFINRIKLMKNEQSYVYKLGLIKHTAHYTTAWNIFTDYPLFGVGVKNFRHVCSYEKYFDIKLKHTASRCSTHPHQIHFEILSELGIFGYLIIFTTIFYILVKSFCIYLKKRNLIHLSSILYIFASLIPLLPSGSFFSSFYGTIFWINFSIVYFFSKRINHLTS